MKMEAVMKNLDKLQESYEKELELAKKHKKKAEELKQKIDEQKSMLLQRKMQELNLTPEEYEKFIDFVSDKKIVLSVLSPEEVEKAIREEIPGAQREEEMKAVEG